MDNNTAYLYKHFLYTSLVTLSNQTLMVISTQSVQLHYTLVFIVFKADSVFLFVFFCKGFLSKGALASMALFWHSFRTGETRMCLIELLRRTYYKEVTWVQHLAVLRVVLEMLWYFRWVGAAEERRSNGYTVEEEKKQWYASNTSHFFFFFNLLLS